MAAKLYIELTGMPSIGSDGPEMHPDLLSFFAAIGIDLYQGYSLTETSPVTRACTPAANKIGAVGKVMEGTECRIDADGELPVKGPQVMRGYHNNWRCSDDCA